MIQNRIFFVLAAFSFVGCSHIGMGLFLLKDDPTMNDPSAAVLGKSSYQASCAGCHGDAADGTGPDGKGLIARPTNFLAPEYTKSTPRIAARIVYGKGEEMPAFGGQLPEKTIWQIARYLHSLQRPSTAAAE